MIHIQLKSYNKSLLTFFSSFLFSIKKNQVIKGPISLPCTYSNFTVRKSPHVFGRSKENYRLRTYSTLFIIKSSRKKDIRNILNVLKSKRFAGIGIKVSFI